MQKNRSMIQSQETPLPVIARLYQCSRAAISHAYNKAERDSACVARLQDFPYLYMETQAILVPVSVLIFHR